jgi:hypothetical protein
VRLSFGTFLFDTDTRELLAGGEPVHLTPKAFRLRALPDGAQRLAEDLPAHGPTITEPLASLVALRDASRRPPPSPLPPLRIASATPSARRLSSYRPLPSRFGRPGITIA